MNGWSRVKSWIMTIQAGAAQVGSHSGTVYAVERVSNSAVKIIMSRINMAVGAMPLMYISYNIYP